MGGFMDKAKDALGQHDDKVDDGLEKAGDFADDKTGGDHSDKIDKAVDLGQEKTGTGDQSA